MAYGSGFAGTTITTVPVGTVVTKYGSTWLGNTSADTDTLNVLGVGTQWKNDGEWRYVYPWGRPAYQYYESGRTYVGYSGTGTLNIENGGVVSSEDGYVGMYAGSHGTVKVTGAGAQWRNSSGLTVGESGNGTLNIENGGVVNNSYAMVGSYTGGNGTVKVTGTGSQWKSVHQIVVGRYGSGTLNIENGGVVSNSYGFVGDSVGGIGTVKVTGAGSQWNNTHDLYVGSAGTANLNVQDLGKVTASALYIAKGTVNLDGGTLQVGSGSIAPGGAFNWISGALAFTGNTNVGSGLLASTTTLGTGKTLNVANNLTVGTGSTLQTTGGTLSAGTLTLDGGTFETGGATTTGGLFNWLKGTLSLTGDASVGSGVLTSTTTLGTGKTLNVANNLTVGDSNQARILSIENGGVASNYFGYVGNTAGSSGTVTVTGAGSQWNNSGRLYVGNSGTGTLNIENGGVVSSAAVFSSVGYNTGSQGVVNVTGAGSQWNNSGQLYVGVSGTGTLNVANGGVVSNSQGRVGYLPGSTGVVKVTGASSQWNNSGGVTIGDLGNGNLSIENGGMVSNSVGVVGGDPGGMGVVKVTGVGSQWSNSSMLSVGSYGPGFVDILDSGKVTTTALNIGTKGAVNLDGGSLQVGSGSIASGGVFNWASGALDYTGNASVGSGLLGSTTTLGTGKALNVASNLTIGSGNTVALAGGQFSANTLTLSGGSITSTGAVDLANTGILTGRGTVSGNVTGGATNTITASGGALTLGNANANSGYAFGGTLNVGSQQVALLSADKAQLGITTNLGAGGTLSTVNGANLANGNTVSFNGDSTIQGNFTNNGSVAGSAGTLNFANNVNGAGSYAGNIAFQAAFNPGNSPASVSFGGGNATFASTSVLTMELLGSAPGTQYDQLVGINSLSFNGKLNLVFAEGYVPLTGSSFALFGFNSFNGSFGTAENGYASITVAGYDRAKLDFSHLATDGTLRLTSVAAVPEPESYAMFLAGLALMGVMARRSRQAVSV